MIFFQAIFNICNLNSALLASLLSQCREGVSTRAQEERCFTSGLESSCSAMKNPFQEALDAPEPHKVWRSEATDAARPEFNYWGEVANPPGGQRAEYLNQ